MKKLYLCLNDRKMEQIEITNYSISRLVNTEEQGDPIDNNPVNQFLSCALANPKNLDNCFSFVGEKLTSVEIIEKDTDTGAEETIYSGAKWTIVSEAREYLTGEDRRIVAELLII